MNQSVYTRTDAETPRGVTRLRAGGGFRFHPKTMRMQIFFAGLWNSWGHQFDKWGRSFLSDGAGFNGLAYTFPGAQFNPVPYGQRTLDLISPGRYPKFCALEIVSGDSIPKDWQDTIVTCDFRANRVTRFSLIEKDSGFETVQEADLLRTSESTFRPIDIKQGPDGALYIADWSNPIINHGEVDFRDPRRDRWHGRIWRVNYKGTDKTSKVTDYTKLSTLALLEHLASNDRYARDKARRVLILREDTKQTLADWADAQDDFGKLQALWLYQAMNWPKYDLLEELLSSANADARAAATRVLGDWTDPLSDLAEPMPFTSSQAWYDRLVVDQHPQVRLEAIIGLSHQQHPTAARIALRALGQSTDRFIEFSLTELLSDVAEPVLNSLREQTLPDKQLEFTLSSVPPQKASSFVGSYLAENPIPQDGSGPWIELLGKTGGKAELERLLNALTNGKFDTAATARGLKALSEAQRLRKTAPQENLGRVSQFFASSDQKIRQQAIQLSGLWKLKELSPSLAELATDTSLDNPTRLAAIDALREMQSTDQLKKMLPTDPALAARVLSSLATLAPQEGITRFLSLQSGQPSESDSVAYWRAILSNKSNKDLLPERMVGIRFSPAAAQAGLRVAQEGGRDAKQLVELLKQMQGETMAKLTSQEIANMAEAAKKGDPFRGETIYSNPKLACVTCHAIAGLGGQVGPDLSSVGASAPIDYLAESLYTPDAKVKENYHSTVILDDSGQQHVGIESGSTPQEVVLRLADNKLLRIPRSEIEDQQAGPSLMPAGLVERLPKQDQVDLIAFLSSLGKPGAFDTSQQNVARQFEIFAGTHRVEQNGIEKIISGEAKGWKPFQSRVNGDLTKVALLSATKQHFNISLVTIYLRTSFTVDESKEIQVSVQGPEEVVMWLNGENLKIAAGENSIGAKATVKPGTHELIVRVDARDLPEMIKVLCDNVAFGR